jgi:hypothetical protein
MSTLKTAWRFVGADGFYSGYKVLAKSQLNLMSAHVSPRGHLSLSGQLSVHVCVYESIDPLGTIKRRESMYIYVSSVYLLRSTRQNKRREKKRIRACVLVHKCTV